MSGLEQIAHRMMVASGIGLRDAMPCAGVALEYAQEERSKAQRELAAAKVVLGSMSEGMRNYENQLSSLKAELADCQENRSQERADAAEDNLHLSQHLEKAEEDLRAMRLRAEAAEARNNQEEGQ